MRNLMLLALLALGLIGLASGAATLAPATEPSAEGWPLVDSEYPDSECSSVYPLRAPSIFSIGFHKASSPGWAPSFSVTNLTVSGRVCLEKYENGPKSQPLPDVDDVALRAATRELARRLVFGQVRAAAGHEVRCFTIAYEDEESATNFQGMFSCTTEDLPAEIADLARKLKGSGDCLPPSSEGHAHLNPKSVPYLAYLRVYGRRQNGGRRERAELIDITLDDTSKDKCFRSHGKVEHLAFLTSIDRKSLKLAVKELARRVVIDKMEGIRSDKRDDAAVTLGYYCREAHISARFFFSSEEDLAKGLREILAALKQGASGNDSASQAPPEIF